MADNETATTTINLLNRELSVPAPYAEGHAISAIEAKVLNRTFAENIANNMRKFFKAIDDGAEGALSEKAALAKFAEYAAGYEFTEAAAGGSRATQSPVEKWAIRIAKDFLKAHLAKPTDEYPQGRTVKEVKESNPEGYDVQVARIADLPKVKAMAEERAKEEAAEKAKREKEMNSISIGDVEIAA